jgi:hypothetical protein
MLLFRSEEHVTRWRELRGMAQGGTLTPLQGWQLAQSWYADKLHPDWRRKTPEEAQRVFTEIGLTGAFWNLKP